MWAYQFRWSYYIYVYIYYFKSVAFNPILALFLLSSEQCIETFNAPLDTIRMLFTTENNGCVWKYTSDTYNAFQASEMNLSQHILSGCLFVCLFIYSLPPCCHREMVDFCCEWESCLPLATLTFQTPQVQWDILLGKSLLLAFQRCKRFKGVRKGEC